MQVGREFRMARHESRRAFSEAGQFFEDVLLENRHRRQRQQTHHRPHFQPDRAAVGQAQNIVEEPILLVPHVVMGVADAVHRPGDPHGVLEELRHEFLVERVREAPVRLRCAASAG